MSIFGKPLRPHGALGLPVSHLLRNMASWRTRCREERRGCSSLPTLSREAGNATVSRKLSQTLAPVFVTCLKTGMLIYIWLNHVAHENAAPTWIAYNIKAVKTTAFKWRGLCEQSVFPLLPLLCLRKISARFMK